MMIDDDDMDASFKTNIITNITNIKIKYYNNFYNIYSLIIFFFFFFSQTKKFNYYTNLDFE
jgi:hypothetical protein